MLAGRHWDEARQTVIEPINSAIHRHLPRDIKDKNLDAILLTYATETGRGISWDGDTDTNNEFSEQQILWVPENVEETMHVRYERLLALFETIDKAELRIHRIYWDEENDTGYPAQLRLVVRGLGPNGERRSLDQRMRVRIAQRRGTWVLTEETVTARELLSTTQPAFTVATREAGIDDIHDGTHSPIFRLIGGVTASSGVAVGDIDCDGYEDLALLSPSRLTLYRNAADGTFRDITAKAGFPAHLDIAGTGLAFFDADNDGDPDLWVCGAMGERFFRNDDCGTFVDASAGTGLAASRWSSMPSIADYDNDGLLDVFVVRMGDHESGTPKPNWDAHNGAVDSLYHNDGNGRFTDVSAQAKIHSTGWGLTTAWGDYDDDGFPDLYVGNEFGTNSLFHNNRDGTFSNVTKQAGVLDRGAAMGLSWGDYDNDGDLDLFVSNMYANSRWALFHPEFPPPVPWYLLWIPRSDIHRIVDELTHGSTLLRNNGDGTFTDISDAAGVRDAQWGWGAEFFDYDNDGRLDVYAVNGFVTGVLLDDV
jgi:hypothetical protein